MILAQTTVEADQRFTHTVSESGHIGVGGPSTSNGAAIRDISYSVPTPRDTDSDPPTPPSTSNSSFNNSTRLFNASTISQIEDPLQHLRNPLTALGMRGSPGRDSPSSRASTPIPRGSRSTTPSVSSRCLSNTVSGTQCRMAAAGGSDFCRRHVNTPR